MKSTLKKTVGIILSLCLLFSMIPIDNLPLGAVMAAANITLQNGALETNADGWTITGERGYSFSTDDGGYLNLWAEEAGTFSISQTVENMAAGSYSAKVAAVGNEGVTPLQLTVKNNNSEKSETVQVTHQGWLENWGETNVFSTKSIDVSEGDSVTITISGDLKAGEWCGIKNAALEASQAVKNAPITVQKVEGLSNDFIHGVDVSTYISEVQSGVKYYDENGREKNLFQILKESGVNYVRLRLWNCPYVVDADGNYKYVDEEGNEYNASQVAKTEKRWIIEPQTSVSPDAPHILRGQGMMSTSLPMARRYTVKVTARETAVLRT